MCGRYKLTVPFREIVRLYNLTNSVNLPERYNIAPTQDNLRRQHDVVHCVQFTKNLNEARLGRLPSWLSSGVTAVLIKTRFHKQLSSVITQLPPRCPA